MSTKSVNPKSSHLLYLVLSCALAVALHSTALAQTSGQATLSPLVAFPGDTSNISATVTVTDNGSSLTVTGNATGMDPAGVYVSLFYDTSSRATHAVVNGTSLQNACLPTEGFQPPQSFSQMVIGVWLPVGSSTRTLSAVKNGAFDAPVPLAYLPINQIGTISVRQDTRAGQPVPNQPDPNRFRLRACGAFAITP